MEVFDKIAEINQEKETSGATVDEVLEAISKMAETLSNLVEILTTDKGTEKVEEKETEEKEEINLDE